MTDSTVKDVEKLIVSGNKNLAEEYNCALVISDNRQIYIHPDAEIIDNVIHFKGGRVYLEKICFGNFSWIKQ